MGTHGEETVPMIPPRRTPPGGIGDGRDSTNLSRLVRQIFGRKNFGVWINRSSRSAPIGYSSFLIRCQFLTLDLSIFDTSV